MMFDKCSKFLLSARRGDWQAACNPPLGIRIDGPPGLKPMIDIIDHWY
jgi:hypothetical protein